MLDKELNILFLLRVVNCNDGISSYCETLLNGLFNSNIKFFIASGPVNADVDSLKKKQKSIESSVVEWRIFPRLRLTPSIHEFIEIVKFTKANNIKIVNIHGLSMLLWGRALCLVTGARLVATYHPSAWGDLNKVRAIAEERLEPSRRLALNLLFPDALIVLSEVSKNFLERYAPRFKQRIRKIPGAYNPIFRPPEPAERAQARAEFGFAPTDYVCLLLGRLSWNKGQDLLIEAARRVRDRHPELPLKCLFVGMGHDYQELQGLVSQEEVDRGTFKFVGYIERAETAMWAADVFVLPSRVEGFALAVVEAMASGLPPIRTPSGGASDQIVDGESGFIIPFDDADALAKAIIVLADPEKRKIMSANTVARAARLFSAEAMCKSTHALYTELSQR